MTDRKFDIAGFSTLAGKRKVRFANGTTEARTKVLIRNGHTDIDLRRLPNPMTKVEAMEFLGVNETDEAAPKGVQARAAKASKIFNLTNKASAEAIESDDEVTA